MKLALVSLIAFLSVSSAFAQNGGYGACVVSGLDGWGTGTLKACITVECDNGNPDSRVVNFDDAELTNKRLMTVITKLLMKDYKIVGQVIDGHQLIYTLAK